MKEEIRQTTLCEKCGESYIGYPAISRIDNRTPICPDCGIREALKSLGLYEKEQERIIEIIHKSTDSITNN